MTGTEHQGDEAMASDDAESVARLRRARRLRFGTQRSSILQQRPSGSGPLSHGPPSCRERRHSHRPFSIRGWQTVVTRHLPPAPGPSVQGLPSARWPHTHLSCGRS